MYLYVIFLVLILVGAAGVFLLKTPASICDKTSDNEQSDDDEEELKKSISQDSNGAVNRLVDEYGPNTDGLSSLHFPGSQRTHGSRAKGDSSRRLLAGGKEDVSEESWLSEFMGTLGLFGSVRMLMLTSIIFYTGFNQPYQ